MYAKIKQINQFSATECGIASLAMLLAYHDVHIGMEELRERCGASRDGTSAATLIKVAEDYGFEAAAYRVELEDITKLSQPVIAYWCFQHYVVIKGVSKNRVFINDPAIGERSVSFNEFDQCFTGVIIHLQATDRVVPVAKKTVLPSMLKTWLQQYTYELACLLLCLLLAAIVPLVHARFSAIVIDLGVVGGHHNILAYLLPPILIISVISIALFRIQKLIQFRLTAKASVIKSSELISHIFRLPLLFFCLRQKSEIIAILARAESVAQILFNSFSGLMINCFAAVTALCILFAIDSQLSLMLLLLLTMMGLILSILVSMNAAYEQSNLPRIGKYSSNLLACTKNIETIKIGGIESKMLATLQSIWHDKINSQDKSNITMLLVQLIVQQFNTLTMLLMLVLGINRMAQGVLTPGAMMSFYSIQLYFTAQITSMFSTIKSLQQAYVAQLRINELQSSSVDNQLPEHQHHLLDNAIVRCIEVSFHYNHLQAPVLANINLQIYSGQHIGLVGRTGSGKSTLAKLLANLYQPTIGKILSAQQLPKQIAYVSQETNLFSGTIHDNLTLWQSDIPDDVINTAINQAGLTDIITKRGLHAQVTEAGSNFSGGERQRIEIARALIQQPSLLVLDEATAALDVETEMMILERIRALPLTVIHVAHRLETIKHCDQICVMEQGRIIERGSHAELMAAQSSYYQLVKSEQVI